ncbi:Short C-terminal domain-containing protein [Lutibacter agarilyticus]|uniref:Short C-terminal domain-containing protein n=1 Tax=Lutibacter agarilyticus TaxID=1109740 RepID=A0A238XNH9_9FLAO|nr:SHOCT domain-containing protein [Lutibacter agarilyticus]SNR60138.1 Short C-terminal domain-containing protein [Lutibacter agarilyticus]
MRKFTIIIILILSVNLSFAQKKVKLKNYKASNEVTYKIGDQIKLTKGSRKDLKFESIRYGIFGGLDKDKLTPANQGVDLTILKIIKYEGYVGYNIVEFVVTGPTTTLTYNHYLDIEKAIKLCEIENCGKTFKNEKVIISSKKNENNSELTKYDKLRELKKLLDEGVLTEKEYQDEKKKILDSN